MKNKINEFISNINKNNIIHFILFISFAFVYLYTLIQYGMGHNISRIRYYFLVVNIVVSFISLLYRKVKAKDKQFIAKEMIGIPIVCILFYIFSIIRAIQANHALDPRCYVQICLILLPAIYAFILINIFSKDEIKSLFELTVIICIIMYFCEERHTILEFFKISNWMQINLLKSNSFTESSFCSDLFLYSYMFFVFFKDKFSKEEQKTLKIFEIISLVFTVLCFKRLALLTVALVFIYDKIKYKKNGKFRIETIANNFTKTSVYSRIKTSHLYAKIEGKGILSKIKENRRIVISFLIALVFVILTVLYTKIMQGELFKGLDIYKFSTGRNFILSLWKDKGYVSYGYGSSLNIINRYLEMDFIEIYLELNILCLFAFCFVYAYIGGANLFSNVIVLCVLTNMLTASSLPHFFGTFIIFLLLNAMDKYELDKKGESSNDRCDNSDLQYTNK